MFETPLTPRADSAMFRKVYPVSPALVETLVAVSSLLQRERTALKVMLQILVDRRETLDLGEIVPVGDLFDAIAEGDEPFTESTHHHFENARNLYPGTALRAARRRRDRVDCPRSCPVRRHGGVRQSRTGRDTGGGRVEGSRLEARIPTC